MKKDKAYMEGMVAGAKPFEDKYEKIGEQIEQVKVDIEQKLKEEYLVQDSINDCFDKRINNFEKKKLFDLNTVYDIKDEEVLNENEQEYLLAYLMTLSNKIGIINEKQQQFIFSIANYLELNINSLNVSLEAVENIEKISGQQAFLQTVLEFLFLMEEKFDCLEAFADELSYFSVSPKKCKEIQDKILSVYGIFGTTGIIEKYAYVPTINDDLVNEEIQNADAMLSKGIRFFLDRKFELALEVFEELAEKGNARAMYYLSMICESGLGNIAIDKEKAERWRKNGKESGDVLAILNYAYFLSEDSIERDKIFYDIFDNVLKMAEENDVIAQYYISNMYMCAQGTRKDLQQATLWVMKSAEGGFWQAMIRLGLMYRYGEGIEKNLEQSFLWFLKAAEIGVPRAMYLLGECYEQGLGVQCDSYQSFVWFEKAAIAGNIDAMYKTAEDYKFGYDFDNMHKNPQEAFMWFKKAAELGHMESQYEIANFYYYGKSYNYGKVVEVNKEEAKKWFHKAAEQGHEKARSVLAEQMF